MQVRTSKNTLILSVISFLIVIYAEWIYPSKAFNQCKWPISDNAKHVAIIADPQIIDDYSYPGRRSYLRTITEGVTDRFMARNFRFIHKKMKPDMIVFVGDLMDGGREWENKAWELEYQRYRRMFPITSAVPQLENVPGNHDVGSVDDIIPNAYKRFEDHFGKSNRIIPFAGHSLVTLDTNALMNTVRPSIQNPARNLLDDLKSRVDTLDPIIIFSHVPLYRPEGSPCGFERKSGPLAWAYGHQYITEVDPTLSSEIIQNLNPSFIFSGDDHDSCKYTHRWGAGQSAEENTIRSFSMAMDVSRPGFQLLSLDTLKHKSETTSCLVAKPFGPIIIQGIMYPLLLLLSIYYTRRTMNKFSSSPSLPVSNDDNKMLKKASQDTHVSWKLDLIINVLAIALSWALGQWIIERWSYSSI